MKNINESQPYDSFWLANKKIGVAGEANQEGLESNQFLGVCCQVGNKHIGSSILEPCFFAYIIHADQIFGILK